MIEIERKFLIDSKQFKKWLNSQSVYGMAHYEQGYICEDPAVRIRLIQDNDYLPNVRGLLTIKGKTKKKGISRFEWELPFTNMAGVDELMKLCRTKVEKYRYVVRVGGHTWEVDQFLGALKGFWLAEIELKAENESFVRPAWALKEVSHDSRYSNTSLARKGLPKEKSRGAKKATRKTASASRAK